MRKLASIRRISDVRPIPDADLIEMVRVDGWECVTRKDDFNVGDLCVYFEIDSILPKHEHFEFLESKNYIIRTVKFRGQISQGLALKVEIMNDFMEDITILNEGDDVTDLIGVEKREQDIKIEIKTRWDNKLVRYLKRYKILRKLLNKPHTKNFPTHIISKTDEERVQNLSERIKEMLWNNPVYITEKLDGTSTTVIYRPNVFKSDFMVCTRSNQILYDDGSVFWRSVNNSNLKLKMKLIHSSLGLSRDEYLIVQGETIGPKIQKNKYGLTDFELHIFGMYSKSDKKKVTYTFENIREICDKYCLNHVPFLGYYTISSELYGYQFVNHYVEMSKGLSVLHETQREGIVVRTIDGSISFKAINPEFLIKNGE